MRILSSFLLLALIAFPATMILQGRSMVLAEEDAVIDDEESDAEVEAEEGTAEAVAEPEVVEPPAEEDEGDDVLKKSPDADCQILFVKPTDSHNLPAGSLVNVIVGFTNNGKTDFLVTSLEASFRYPQDYSYFIQNFSRITLDKVVEPRRQASFEYFFTPSENFNSRPFGLTINLNYQDKDGKAFQDAVFNETVTITDPEEGFDMEAFFMYITLAAIILLVFVGLQQTVLSSASKKLTSSKAKVELGTQKNGDIDYDWIPKEALQKQTKQSPRKRNRGSSGSGDE